MFLLLMETSQTSFLLSSFLQFPPQPLVQKVNLRDIFSDSIQLSLEPVEFSGLRKL